jgi:uncharacterized zinc-type alcohol dehydrogenase-like protein
MIRAYAATEPKGRLELTESFPMSRVNEALEHLESGRARYRIVLESDFA